MGLKDYDVYKEVKCVKNLIRYITELESNQIEVQNYEENLHTVQNSEPKADGDERYEYGDGGSSANPTPSMKRKKRNSKDK